MKPIPVDLNDHNRLVVEFKDESDRGVAVLAGSLIENYLAKYLKYHMTDDPKINDLFQGVGPFSDFGKRIDCAYAFHLISKKEKEVLSKIKKVRNYFAHNLFDATFDKQTVSAWCRSILIRDLLPNTSPDPDQDKSKELNSAKERHVSPRLIWGLINLRISSCIAPPAIPIKLPVLGRLLIFFR
jgi:hypothetical protein